MGSAGRRRRAAFERPGRIVRGRAVERAPAGQDPLVERRRGHRDGHPPVVRQVFPLVAGGVHVGDVQMFQDVAPEPVRQIFVAHVATLLDVAHGVERREFPLAGQPPGEERIRRRDVVGALPMAQEPDEFPSRSSAG